MLDVEIFGASEDGSRFVAREDGLIALEELGKKGLAVICHLSYRGGRGGAEEPELGPSVTCEEAVIAGVSTIVLNFSSGWSELGGGMDSAMERLLILALRVSGKIIVDPCPSDKDDVSCLERWLGVFSFLLPLLRSVEGDTKQLASLLTPTPVLLTPITAGVGMAKLSKKLVEYLATDEPNISIEAGKRNQLRHVVRAVMHTPAIVATAFEICYAIR